MTTFVCLYHGQTVASARILALSADPQLVADVAARLLQDGLPENPDDEPDPVGHALRDGQHQALRLVTTEAGRDGA